MSCFTVETICGLGADRLFSSKEAMSRMTEAQLSRIDNLEIGRYGFGAVKWPGWTETFAVGTAMESRARTHGCALPRL